MQIHARRGMPHQNEYFLDVDFLQEQQAMRSPGGGGHSPFLATLSREAACRRRSALLNLLIDESLRLKSRLLELQQSRGVRAVVFASANAGEGVSSVIMNLAKAFEKTEATRLLVIDANCKSPGLSNYLGTRGLGKGLLDLLAHPEVHEGALQKIQGTSLYFMSHGRKRRHPEELLQPQRLERLLGEMKSLFDLILIDAPPLRNFPDGFLWGRVADGMILVIHAQRTTMHDVRFVQTTAQQQQIDILGNVLNRRTYSVPRFIYEWL